MPLAEECLHHGLHVEVLEVTVGLSSPHKHYGLACDVRHQYGSSHLRTYMDGDICTGYMHIIQTLYTNTDTDTTHTGGHTLLLRLLNMTST